MANIKVKCNETAFEIAYEGMAKNEMLYKVALGCIKELMRTKPGRKKLGDFDRLYNCLWVDINELILQDVEDRRIKWEQKHGGEGD